MAHKSWGAGWPRCQSSRIKTLARGDGLKVALRVEALELFSLLIDETERLGYDVKPGQTWGFACRPVRGTNTPSNHSWGLAIDLNAPENPMGPRTGRIRQFPQVIELWKRFGFRWGGDYTNRADDMHLEYMGSVDQCREHTRIAREQLGKPQPAPAPAPSLPPASPWGPRPYPGYKGKYGGYNREEFEGKRDGNVEFIQRTINNTNINPKLTPDGDFGKRTEAAVKGFQGAVGLKQDGVCGPVTWGRLNQWAPVSR